MLLVKNTNSGGFGGSFNYGNTNKG